MMGRFSAVIFSVIFCHSCASIPIGRVLVGDQELNLYGLAGCGQEHEGPVVLSKSKPLTMLVHGCNASAGQFKTLAQVFEAHGQQTVCFSYDDRDSLSYSSSQVLDAIQSLGQHLAEKDLTILGHSQGGLVVRRALIQERLFGLRSLQGLRLRLVTISSPFGGIEAASHCGSLAMHILTFGISAAICQAVTGNKWMEIHPDSNFVLSPGALISQVAGHLKVVTNEEDSCLVREEDGSCSLSDFVFGVDEQYNAQIDKDQRVSNIELDAGHSAIVGLENKPPLALIELLQNRGVLLPTPVAKRAEVDLLLTRLYR